MGHDGGEDEGHHDAGHQTAFQRLPCWMEKLPKGLWVKGHYSFVSTITRGDLYIFGAVNMRPWPNGGHGA